MCLCFSTNKRKILSYVDCCLSFLVAARVPRCLSLYVSFGASLSLSMLVWITGSQVDGAIDSLSALIFRFLRGEVLPTWCVVLGQLNLCFLILIMEHGTMLLLKRHVYFVFLNTCKLIKI